MSPGPEATLIVIAKAPIAGRSKTRLCPPCTPPQAAVLAEAALVDTLAAVAATPASRRLLALDGAPGAWLPAGFELVEQPGGGLDERIVAAFDAARGPAFLVGMDTPQLTAALLATVVGQLCAPGGRRKAVLGPATDGGYWGLGLRDPSVARAAVAGIPMSVEGTAAAQRERLERLGLLPIHRPDWCASPGDRLRGRATPTLRDVDTWDDALAVAALAPRTRFAAALTAVGRSSNLVGARA